MSYSFIRSIVVLMVLLGGNVVQSEESSQPYGRRVYQLGMTLTKFRSIPHPDTKEWPNAFPVCSNDPNSKKPDYSDVRPSEYLQKVGVIQCQFFWRLSQPLAGRSVLGAGLMLGDIPSKTEFYFLRPDNRPDYLLFQIRSGGPAEKADYLLQILKRAYGEPSSSSVEKWQNRAGAAFSNLVTRWRNTVSEVELRSLGDTINVFSLTHTLTSVNGELRRRLDGIRANDAKRI